MIFGSRRRIHRRSAPLVRGLGALGRAIGLAWRRSLQLRVVSLTLGLSLAVILVLGFVPTFFLLLTSPDPCDTALGACGSISRDFSRAPRASVRSPLASKIVATLFSSGAFGGKSGDGAACKARA